VSDTNAFRTIAIDLYETPQPTISEMKSYISVRDRALIAHSPALQKNRTRTHDANSSPGALRENQYVSRSIQSSTLSFMAISARRRL
jgi:hypothetical protein